VSGTVLGVQVPYGRTIDMAGRGQHTGNDVRNKRIHCPPRPIASVHWLEAGETQTRRITPPEFPFGPHHQYLSTGMHRERHMVNLWSGIELVLVTITEDVNVYIHTKAVTQLPVLLPVLLPVARPVARPVVLPVVILIERR
jgi:hypothetical protein